MSARDEILAVLDHFVVFHQGSTEQPTDAEVADAILDAIEPWLGEKVREVHGRSVMTETDGVPTIKEPTDFVWEVVDGLDRLGQEREDTDLRVIALALRELIPPALRFAEREGHVAAVAAITAHVKRIEPIVNIEQNRFRRHLEIAAQVAMPPLDEYDRKQLDEHVIRMIEEHAKGRCEHR